MPSPVRRSTRGALPSSKARPSVSHASSSSLSSTRVDRNPRGALPPKAATTPRSLSSEDTSEPPRRSQRSQLANHEDSLDRDTEAVDEPDAEPAEEGDEEGKEDEDEDEEDEDEDEEDEEEITRCICGQQEYPGPPLSEAFAANPDANSDDAGGLFILCDGCSVWQHGGCVGIVEESQSPDKYYCEECRPKLHQVHTDPRGQKYSLYLPLHPKAQRKGSVSKSDEKAKKERDALLQRASVDPSTGRRRGTMRSKEHDDEEEQLKRAIEESKREVESTGGSSRRNGKRGRDESEDVKADIKRQRTGSESITRTASLDGDSDDDGLTTTTSRVKKAKAEAAQTARQAEQKEKDRERDQARAEAAGRRQERAGRRRADESEPVEDPGPRPNSPPQISSQPPTPPPERATNKRAPSKKAKKLGNNQYTSKRAVNATLSPRRRPLHSQNSPSGDEAVGTTNGDVNGSHEGTGKNSPAAAENGTGKSRFGKGRKGGVNGSTPRHLSDDGDKTLANMKSALEAMSAWVAKQQADLPHPLSEDSTPVAGGGAVQPPLLAIPRSIRAADDDRRFEDLSSAEMAERLQGSISQWQEFYGHLV